MFKSLLKSIVALIIRLAGFTPEIPSPPNLIPIDSIKYDKKDGTITIGGLEPGVWLTTPVDTNSMDGLMDIGNTVILTNNPKFLNKRRLKEGAVIVWQKQISGVAVPLVRITVIHQIVEVGEDKEGWYCITKGVNNFYPDIYKIRMHDIIWIMLGVIF